MVSSYVMRGRAHRWLAALLTCVVCALSLAVPGYADAPTGRTGGIESPAAPITITHSVSQVIQQGNSEACGNTPGGYTLQNSFWRVFDLDQEFGLVAPLSIDRVRVGVERTTGIFTVEVRIYALTGTFALENLTLLGVHVRQVDNTSNGMLYDAGFFGETISHQEDLVVEMRVSSGEAQQAVFYPASNDLGQSAPSYLSAPACGFTEPTDLATIGYPNMHLVMNVYGDTTLPTAVTVTDFAAQPETTVDLAAAGALATVGAAGMLLLRRRHAALRGR